MWKYRSQPRFIVCSLSERFAAEINPLGQAPSAERFLSPCPADFHTNQPTSANVNRARSDAANRRNMPPATAKLNSVSVRCGCFRHPQSPSTWRRHRHVRHQSPPSRRSEVLRGTKPANISPEFRPRNSTLGPGTEAVPTPAAHPQSSDDWPHLFAECSAHANTPTSTRRSPWPFWVPCV